LKVKSLTIFILEFLKNHFLGEDYVINEIHSGSIAGFNTGSISRKSYEIREFFENSRD